MLILTPLISTPMRKIEIIKHLKDTEAEEAGIAMFTCELNYADVEVQWFLNRRALCHSAVNELKHTGRSHSLTLKQLPAADSVVTIQAGDARESAALRIKTKLPMFVKHLEDVVAEEKARACLHCEASCTGVSPIWRKDGVILAANDKYELQQFCRSISLIICTLSKQDAGEYTCQLGSALTRCKLTVK
ncbi:hypothetical protein JZ751_013996, partial [Albula glossodonta]